MWWERLSAPSMGLEYSPHLADVGWIWLQGWVWLQRWALPRGAHVLLSSHCLAVTIGQVHVPSSLFLEGTEIRDTGTSGCSWDIKDTSWKESNLWHWMVILRAGGCLVGV